VTAYRAALRANPRNEAARYNLEMCLAQQPLAPTDDPAQSGIGRTPNLPAAEPPSEQRGSEGQTPQTAGQSQVPDGQLGQEGSPAGERGTLDRDSVANKLERLEYRSRALQRAIWQRSTAKSRSPRTKDW
jgi:hypothetical protein